MTEENIPNALYKNIRMMSKGDTDNRLSNQSCDNPPSEKLLYRLFSDTSNRNVGIAKDNTLKSRTVEVINQIQVQNILKSTEDQIKSMNQRNTSQVEIDEQTHPKQGLGEVVDMCEEKHDIEKEAYIAVSELEKNDKYSINVPLKEDLEESEKSSNCGSVNVSDDSQYVSIAPNNVDFLSDEESNGQCDHVILKEDFEALEKDNVEALGETTSLIPEFDPNFDSEEPLKRSIEDAMGWPDSQQESFDSACEDDDNISENFIRMDGQKANLCLTNELSLVHFMKCRNIGDMNILMSSLESIETSSFNQFHENMKCDAASNMLIYNIHDKDFTKKSPQSMFNRHSASSSMKYEELDIMSDPCLSGLCSGLHNMFAESDELLSSGHDGFSMLAQYKPRERSESGNKSKGRRHRSKKHGNNRGGGRRNGPVGSNGGTNSLGSGGNSGGAGGGEGNDGDDDRGKKASGGTNDEEEDEDDGESDDDNKEGSDEKEAEATGNLLPTKASAQDKAMDKDLTFLLGCNSMQEPQDAAHGAPQPEGVFSWQIEAEGATSFLHEQQDELDELVVGHSCVSLDTFCDILGGASGEDYVPKDDLFKLLNPCLTTLTHNLSLAFGGLDCYHCITLSEQMKHLAKCEIVSCSVCIQGNNLILHHVKICIENNRRIAPLNRMDLCFKLCQHAQWNTTRLFDTNKVFNKIMIKKYCNKILTLPIDHEVSSFDKEIEDKQSQTKDKADESLIKPDVRPKCNRAPSMPSREVGKDPKQSMAHGARRSSGGLIRKPSTSRRSIIHPSIHEDEEDEENRKKSSDESAETILRKRYEQKAAEGASAGFADRDHYTSLPQVHINDQTQFISLVHGPTGVKGVGEVVYGGVAQLCLVANFWGEKKDEYKSTGKRPYQLAEEGVILEKYKSKLKILKTRYKMDCQWHKLISLGGGMTGRCYLARDSESEFRFCVKKLNLIDYKKEELCLWADLKHPSIVTLYGAVRHSDVVFLFTEYIDGGDLAHCIDEHKSRGERLSHWLALNYFQQLLDILLYLESKNLLHEDIKADNILLKADTFQIVLTDFGLCHRLQKAVELKDKAPAGTVTHFSPEKAASMGHGFPACVWACVCVLVQMLSGQQPWQKYLKKVDYLNFTIYMKPPPLEDVPDNVRAIVKDLIAQGFTKDPEKRPNARQLLQHEAFNIIKQEPETYLSTLASAFQTNVGTSSRPQRERTSATKDVATARYSQKDNEECVSLYEISLPNNAENRLMSGIIQSSGNCDAGENNGKMLQVSKVEREDDGSDEELEGAVGGDVSMGETKIMERIDQQNPLANSIADGGTLKDGDETYQNSDEVDKMIAGTIPQLDLLLQTSESTTLSFLTDITSANLNNHPTLEVYDPDNNSRNINRVPSDQLPNLSIFDPFAWDKVGDRVLQSGSSSEIDSKELYVSGKEIIDASSQPPQNYLHFIDKKPVDLKLNVQDSQEKLTWIGSRKSNSTTATASSQGSSVFFTGSASATAGQDFKVLGGQKEDEDKDETLNVEDDVKIKVDMLLEHCRKSINEDTFDGLKLTLYDENGEKLLSYRIPENDKQLPVNHHISAFKAKIKIKHFELTKMDGSAINYQSCLKSSELMAVAKPETAQCWCAGCQF